MIVAGPEVSGATISEPRSATGPRQREPRPRLLRECLRMSLEDPQRSARQARLRDARCMCFEDTRDRKRRREQSRMLDEDPHTLDRRIRFFRSQPSDDL